MNTARELSQARRRAGISQATLAARTGTSQATISAYERGRKQPSIETLDRLLAACGARLKVDHDRPPLHLPSARQHAQAGRTLVEVLALAEALPTRREPELRFPRLAESTRGR